MEFHHLKIFFVALAVFCLAFFGFGLYYLVSYLQAHSAPTTVSIENKTSVVVAVADTDALRRRGLSGRPVLGELEGMLFVFDTEGEWGICMKDMNFPIDIIWVGQDGTVVTVAKDVSPDTYPQAFYPSVPARFVLEVPAGFVAAHDIDEGSRLSIENANAPR